MKVGASEKILRDILSSAGISIDGKNPWDIKVHNKNFFKRILGGGSIGFGESYMDGWWDCDVLDECITKILRTDIDRKIKKNWKASLHVLKSKLFNLQSRRRAFEVGEKHYDIGNDLYRAMLGRRMLYSCAYWKGTDTLDLAQEAKLELVCRKIGLKPGMHVLELGCGWGSFARYAAEKYNARVTGITVSREQLSLGTELCKGLPVELRLQDYRDVTEKYDAVISIGMFEHVGYKNYGTCMKTVHRCLKDDGIAFIQTIGRNDCSTSMDPWIHRYIFPNGMLPSIARIGRSMNDLFVMEDWHNFGPDYDRTLMAWYDNFERSWPELRHKYDERFYRMWRFYLLSCAGGFRSRTQQLWQIVMTKIGRTRPDCRFG